MSHSAKDLNAASLDQLLDGIAILAKPRNFLIFCSSAIAFLVLMSLLAVAMYGADNILLTMQLDQPSSILTQIFFLDRETSVPTIFNFALLVASCGLLFFVTRLAFLFENAQKYQWLILGVLFLWLSFDEAAQVHEKITPLMRRLIDTSGVFHFAWVIPAMAFVAIFAIIYLSFLKALPSRIARLMILGGVLYVSGAVGMEMFGGWATASGLRPTWIYVWAVTIEEALEMIGVTVFCTAILTLLSEGSRSKYGYFNGNGRSTLKK